MRDSRVHPSRRHWGTATTGREQRATADTDGPAPGHPGLSRPHPLARPPPSSARTLRSLCPTGNHGSVKPHASPPPATTAAATRPFDWAPRPPLIGRNPHATRRWGIPLLCRRPSTQIPRDHRPYTDQCSNNPVAGGLPVGSQRACPATVPESDATARPALVSVTIACCNGFNHSAVL